MGIKSVLGKPFAAVASLKVKKWQKNAIKEQEQLFSYLIKKARNTSFGQDHDFVNIHTYEDFVQRVPVRDYEALTPYINRMVDGEKDVLWPGKPLYLAKTSGTTSGIKYIPITEESMSTHVDTMRHALFNYVHETGNNAFINGKMIFLQGSPVLKEKNGIKVGRLSGIVAHHIPIYLQRNRLPSYQVNVIEDWEEKIDAIVDETIDQDMRLISGIPPWVQMYYERLQKKSGGKQIKDIFPNYSVFVYGGVNYEPYRAKLEALVGKKVDGIETYPASEGFIAFQDKQEERSMLIAPASGVFYEFIPVDELGKESPARFALKDVKINLNYALVLNSIAGLWGYLIGDTVKFTSLSPYRLVVTGRIKHFISAFGEHVIGEEVESALLEATNQFKLKINEFTVAPQVVPPNGSLPYHEWFVEFEEEPADMEQFSMAVDVALQQRNTYYFDLIEGKILRPLVMRSMKTGTFIDYMRSKGKLGGQNKLPRLANDRSIADHLTSYLR